MTMDVPLADAFDTLQVYLGSMYVNDFNRFGRTWQVVCAGRRGFRNQVDDVRLLKVRNRQGAMVPMAPLADVREVNGPFTSPATTCIRPRHQRQRRTGVSSAKPST